VRAFLAIALVACTNHHDPVPAPPAPPPPQPALAPTTDGAPGSQNLAPLANLGTVLGGESAHRPQVAVTAERVFAALTDHGVALASQHQVLASVAAASYCALGVTGDAIAIAVCEYPSHDAAVAGRDLLDHRYNKLVPDAVRAINGSTLVTVANAATHRDLRDRVLSTFAAL
jgi:hypothetical protein